MRLGTRGSPLALTQAKLVADLLGGAEIITTAELSSAGRGEAEAERGGEGRIPANDKSRWVEGLERALIEDRIDIAVHSAKDLPDELPDGLALLGAPPRAAVEDVLVGAVRLADLAAGARIGTSSLRRTAQLKAARPDLELVALAGNVDTRLRRLHEGELSLDAIVLARAGLERLGLRPEPQSPLDARVFVPAPGQGALALEGRAGDRQAHEAAAAISDDGTLACLRAERALAAALGATCNTPIGASATLIDGEPEGSRQVGRDGRMRLEAWVGLPDGSAWARDELTGSAAEAEALGERMAGRMNAAGAAQLLGEAEGMVLERA